MLPSAYIRELTPQSSAGSKLLPQQQKSFREVLFTAENTLPQPSFRNSLLNTVLHCKPQLAIYFIYLPHYLVSVPSRLILSLCNLPPFRITWFQCPVA